MRFLASAEDVKDGIAGVVGENAGLFDDLSASAADKNKLVDHPRDEVRTQREAGWPGTAAVTRRLLEWWFDRDDDCALSAAGPGAPRCALRRSGGASIERRSSFPLASGGGRA